MSLEHPFVEEQEYFNRFGDYRVVSISGDSMTVEYINGDKTGQKQTLSASGQVRVYRNMVRAKT